MENNLPLRVTYLVFKLRLLEKYGRVGKAASCTSEPHGDSIPPPGDSKPGSPKKIKILMGDPISKENLVVTALM